MSPSAQFKKDNIGEAKKMKPFKLSLFVVLGLALVVTGCAKKATDQTNLTGTGFDAASSTEDLAQLPQQAITANQQQAVEVLPIETSPVTQGIVPPQVPSLASQGATGSAIGQSLSHDQDIQTALKNAGLYQGKIDGKLGPGTKRAISEFQTKNGLKADGKVGPKTWAALEPFLNISSASNTATQTQGN